MNGVIRRSFAAAVLALWLGSAAAEPLLSVDVAAPGINCVFDKTCKLAVTDTVGAIPIPGVSGAILQSRTFAGASGAPAAGMAGYEFRVDLTRAKSAGTKICVTRVTLETGPVARLPYDPGGVGHGEVFVITTGALGTVGLGSAERNERAIRFSFISPVCPGTGSGPGQTSYFFGFAAATAPRAVTARVELDTGQVVEVPARAPAP